MKESSQEKNSPGLHGQEERALDHRKKRKAGLREKVRPYDELVSLSQTALVADPQTVLVVQKLHFQGKSPILCAFLTAAASAELRRSSRGPQLTTWDILLGQFGLNEKALLAFPGKLAEVSDTVRNIEGSFLDPAVELARNHPAETKKESADYTEGIRDFQTLPDTLAIYADCFKEILEQRSAAYGNPSLKLTTLSKALLVRYVREHSRSRGDGAPIPVYQCSAVLLGLVSRGIGLSLPTLKAKALQRIDERALSWTGRQKLYYNAFYQGFIHRYTRQQASLT